MKFVSLIALLGICAAAPAAFSADWTKDGVPIFEDAVSVDDDDPAPLALRHWTRDRDDDERSIPETHSKGYGLNAINNKRNPTIDDWNDAFAGGGSD